MKSLFTLILVFIIAISGSTQKNVQLNLNHLIGNQELELGAAYEMDGQYQFPYKIDRLQYYISEITLIHDGGQRTKVNDVWLLVTAPETKVFDLGDFNINNIEGIEYYVGVNDEVNFLDPSSYPDGHPLANQSPSMHWGWAAGYRFAALEGYSGDGFFLNYQIHSLGEANYKKVSLGLNAVNSGDDINIYLDADYENIFDKINFSKLVFIHGFDGMASELMNILGKNVFSASEISSVNEEIYTDTKFLVSNIADNQILRITDLPGDFEISILNTQGQLIHKQLISGNEEIQLTESGFYFGYFSQNGRLIKTEKILVR
jgi:hypothetical protein